MANGDVQQSSEWISLADWPDADIRVTVGSLLEFRSESQTVDWGVYLDENVVAHFVPSSAPESRGLWEVFASLVPLWRPTDGDVKNTEAEGSCPTVGSDGVVAPLVDNINSADPLINPDIPSGCVEKSEPVAEMAKGSHGMILRTDRISILLKNAQLRVCIPVERSERPNRSGKDLRDLVLVQPDRASPVLTLDAARVYLEKNLCSQLEDSGMSVQPSESSRSEVLPVSLNGGFSSQVQMSGEAVAAYAAFGFVGVAFLSWWRRNR